MCPSAVGFIVKIKMKYENKTIYVEYSIVYLQFSTYAHINKIQNTELLIWMDLITDLYSKDLLTLTVHEYIRYFASQLYTNQKSLRITKK